MFLTLMYHLVSDRILHPMCVSKKMFIQQIEYLLANDYTFLTLDDVMTILHGKKDINNGVLLSFDDGYKNTITDVLPILNEMKIPALLAICSGYLFYKNEMDISKHICDDFANVQDINNWISHGNGIAAHTYSHKNLTECSEEECDEELYKDKDLLEKNFNIQLELLIYPFGARNSSIERIAKRYYKGAFTTEGGEPPSIINRWNIHRTYINPRWNSKVFARYLEVEKSKINRRGE